MTTIIFSKDRAPQLDVLLRSYESLVEIRDVVKVLYLATSPRHARAYGEVFRAHESWVVPYPQGEMFKTDLLKLLPEKGQVVFFVDDQVFVRSWDGNGEPGLSLRLGLNLVENYNSGDAVQPLPTGLRLEGHDRASWKWADGVLAWAYPLSLDGHVFDLAELRPLIVSVEFSSPNGLEGALQRFLPVFLQKRGVCYKESKVVGVPWNRVQDECPNRCGTQHNPEMLLRYWETGRRIALYSFNGPVRSVHQEFSLVLEGR